MRSPSRQKIVIIGCGNVAWHIAKKLSAVKNVTVEVYNHRVNVNLEDFWQQLKCKTIVGLNNIAGDADVYFLCVSDSAISDVSRHVKAKNPRALMVHTSGSADIREMGNRVHSTGVLYPLQSFSKSDEIRWKDVPLLLEAGEPQTMIELKKLASFFSPVVFEVQYAQRLRMHLSAVLVNNFTNSMYVAASDVLEPVKEILPDAGFELLWPLIRQTTRKAIEMGPVKAQTGPAKRRDKKVIKKHLNLLSDQEGLYRLYKVASKLIDEQQRRHAEFQGKAK